MKITILTIFPEMFAPLHLSMLGRAEKAGLLEIKADRESATTDRPAMPVANQRVTFLSCRAICSFS